MGGGVDGVFLRHGDQDRFVLQRGVKAAQLDADSLQFVTASSVRIVLAEEQTAETCSAVRL